MKFTHPNFSRALLLPLQFKAIWIGATLLTSAPAFGQDKLPSSPYVRVHGEATVAVQPDRAELDIGIISQAASAKAATDLNNKQSATVASQLHSVLPATEIKTVNFSVNPTYRFAKDGGTPETLGYVATNTLRLNVDDLTLVQKVIEVATKAGANNVNRLTFLLRDEGKARAQALGQAASQARAGAEALASSLNMKLGPIMSIEEGQPVIVSSSRQAEISTAKEVSPSPALEIGTIQVHASVNLTYAVTP